MDQRPIGILDTGAEGIAFARALQRALPAEQIIFLADTAGGPYGGRSKEWILQRSMQGLEWLRRKEVKLLATACGSIGALLPEADSKRLGIPYLNLLLPCAQEACAISGNGVIGAIGSPEAIHSSAFARTVRNIRPEARVVGKATPLLLSLPRLGNIAPEDPTLQFLAHQALDPLLREGIDTLILGTSQGSPLFGALSAVVEYNINLVDASTATAAYVERYLVQNALQTDAAAAGTVTWFVTDGPELFCDMAARSYGRTFSDPVDLALL